MTKNTKTSCRVNSLRLQFAKLYGGSINVGIGGWLVGVYDSPNRALREAAEHIRLRSGCGHKTPTIPARTRRQVQEWQ
jgi:hypothetical protein